MGMGTIRATQPDMGAMKLTSGPCRNCDQLVLKLHDLGRPIRLDPTPLTTQQLAATWTLNRPSYWVTPHGPIPIPVGDTGLAALPRHTLHVCGQHIPNRQPPAAHHDTPPF